jgi:hypothetical protein
MPTPSNSETTFGLRRDAASIRLLTDPPPPHVPVEDWHILLTDRPNVLLEGNESAIEAVILRLGPHLRPEIHWWRPGLSLSLPLGGGGTVVLRDAAGLEPADQERLVEWLQAVGLRGAQVVSTGTTPLFAAVQQRTFLADLYYQLNIVRIDLDQA